MHAALKKIHIYVGLLSFCIILVWGVVGLYALAAGSEERQRPTVIAEWTQPFTPAPNSTDRQLADAVYSTLKPSLANPIPDYALRRNEQGDLRLDFYSPNGILHVQVAERENLLRVQQTRNTFARFLSNIHGATIGGNSPHWQMRIWTLYTEFSIWSLLAMSASGTMLWLLSRPRYRTAILSAGAGLASFGILYWMVR